MLGLRLRIFRFEYLFLIQSNELCFSFQKGTNKNKNYDSHFQDEWLSGEKYKYWINKDKNDPTKPYCTLCFKSISIAQKGKGNLDENANGKKHK